MNKSKSRYYKNGHLNGHTLEHNGSDTGILLIHGFTATTVEVSKLAQFFISKNFSVTAPLLPGHGTAVSELNKTKYTDWINCIENAFQELSKKCKHVFIGGESMGAVLSLYLAEKYQDISGIFLFSTALLVKKLKYARLMKYFKPLIDKGLPDDDLPWQGYTVYPTFAADQLYRLTKKVKESLCKVKSPALLFQGKYDKSIDPENIEYIYNHIQSKKKKKIILQHSGHVMLLDTQIESIQSEIDQFIDTFHILEHNAGL